MLVIEQVKIHSKSHFKTCYINIEQYNISRNEVKYLQINNNVSLQCQRKLSQLIAFYSQNKLWV